MHNIGLPVYKPVMIVYDTAEVTVIIVYICLWSDPAGFGRLLGSGGSDVPLYVLSLLHLSLLLGPHCHRHGNGKVAA